VSNSRKNTELFLNKYFVELPPLVLLLESDSSRMRDEWAQLFYPFTLARLAPGTPDISVRFELSDQLPSPPAGQQPSYTHADLKVYPAGDDFILHMPKLAQLRVSPHSNRVEGRLSPAVLDTYGALEDITATALAPLLRRRGRALIHAFAASFGDQALLLVGDNASGKTTTGLSLLTAGWQLLANDSPMIGEQDGQVFAQAYPGLISASADALRRVPGLRTLADDPALAPRPGWKISLAAEDHFDSPWGSSAPIRIICLLKLGGVAKHKLEPISPAEALGRLLPHSVDRWDQGTLAFQIDLLQKLAQQASAYVLHLGPFVPALPGLLQMLLTQTDPLNGSVSG